MLQTFSDEIERVTENAGLSVVSVNSDGRAGTGIAWDEGLVATAYHVVGGEEDVCLSSGGRQFRGTVRGFSEESDFALLQTDMKLNPIPKGDSDRLRVGQFVLALANPYDGGVGATSGIVTGVRKMTSGWRRFSIGEAIVTDAKVNPGYSGGPLVNASGQLIGMNVAYVASRAIAVPVSRMQRLTESILSGRKTGRPYLGVGMNFVRLESSDSRTGHGLIVLSVERGSPADKAGILIGDVILTVGEKHAAESLAEGELLTENDIGRETVLGILRAGRRMEIKAVPGQEE